MQLQQTTEQWAGVIADLTTKRQAAVDHLSQLREEKRDLALESAMGSGEAKKQLAKINVELARLALEGDDWDAAVSQAEASKRRAEQVAADVAEQARQEQISSALEKYLTEVRGIDAALEALAAKFAAARTHLDAADALMDGRERQPTQQLRSLFGATLACAHFGLGESIQLGPQAAHVIHRQPLTRYAMGFIDRWLEPEHPRPEGEEAA